jgi:hypothetical protein
MLRGMKRENLFGIAAVLSLACCVTAAAQDLGYWRAASKTAQSITGDVALSEAQISINFSNFAIVRARDLLPAEISSVFDADSNANITGRLYGLSIPGTKKFMHKNTLCGTEDARWLVTYVDGQSLQLAFFSGTKAPTFTPDAISNSTDLCGTFTYTR